MMVFPTLSSIQGAYASSASGYRLQICMTMPSSQLCWDDTPPIPMYGTSYHTTVPSYLQQTHFPKHSPSSLVREPSVHHPSLAAIENGTTHWPTNPRVSPGKVSYTLWVALTSSSLAPVGFHLHQLAHSVFIFSIFHKECWRKRYRHCKRWTKGGLERTKKLIPVRSRGNSSFPNSKRQSKYTKMGPARTGGGFLVLDKS